jgi:hypothetical protein
MHIIKTKINYHHYQIVLQYVYTISYNDYFYYLFKFKGAKIINILSIRESYRRLSSRLQ